MITVIVAIATTGLAALFSMADGALLATHTSPEHAWDSDADRNRREREHRALAMARVVLYLAAGAAIAQLFSFASYGVVPRTAIMVAVALVVVAVTESASRAIGQANATKVNIVAAPATAIATFALTPAVALGTRLEKLLHVILPIPPQDEDRREATAEQFREVVASEAEVSVQEEELIHGVFTLGETEVHEIMVPRVDIVGIETTSPWSEVVDRFRSSEHARLPVYEETLDNIVGILYAKDLLPDVVSEDEEPEDWHRLVRPPAIIPTSKHIDEQLREFQSSRTHIAIVADEYGGTAGLVTIEDILEEIVGEIRDEYDVEEPEIVQEGEDCFWISGRVTIDELSERLGADMSHDDVTTVGGLVYELFGRVPKNGDLMIHNDYRVVVERVRRRRIERVYFERVQAARVPDEE
ncbi:MAG TPA: hemolysin family protein [Gemmatimonadaceae bacterium]|nr:hemolysin family protein [Gemmatimonadaceae bacterium]